MAPVRDIRSFFQPAQKPVQGPAPQGTVQRDANAPRKPTPQHTSTRQFDASRQKTEVLASASTIPAKRSAEEARQPSTGQTPTNRPPSTSQSSTNSGGSKKVILNGEPAVLDSDSDSDILEEFEFPSRKPALQDTSFSASKRSKDMPATRSSLLIQGNGLREPPKAPKAARPSLSHLVQAARKGADTEQRIAATKAALEKPIEEYLPNVAINEEVLASVVQDDENGQKTKRLNLAMQRTNAKDMDCVCDFFVDDVDAGSNPAFPFPTQSLPAHGWVASFETPWHREQLFMSGFAQQVFQYQVLPEELARWMIDQLCDEQNDSLNFTYIQLLEDHPHHLRTILGVRETNTLFGDVCGIDIQRLLNRPVIPTYRPREAPKRPLPRPLKWILQLHEIAAKCLTPDARSNAMLILFQLCLDNSVISDADTLFAVQNTIEAVTCNTPVELTPILDQFVPSLLSRLTHPVLQNKLVQSLPCKSALTASLQRHLSLAFLVYPTPLDVSLSSPISSKLIRDHLDSSPDFDITRDTDHSLLAARLSLLDIAVGPGPTPVPYKFEAPLDSDASSPSPLARPLSAEEKKFNREVDALAEQLLLISNRVVEAGAISDLSRLEAKDCSERLRHRLENAVRIGGPKRRAIFELEDKEPSRMFLGKWLSKKPAIRSATPTLKEDIASASDEEESDGTAGI